MGIPLPTKHDSVAVMNGGNKIVDLWRNREPAAGQPAETEELLLSDGVQPQPEPEDSYVPDPEQEPGEDSLPATRLPAAAILLGAVALGWLAFNAWLLLTRGAPAVEALPGLIATLAIPLILLASLYLILMRNSRAEARRFADTARSLRVESEALEQRLQRLGRQLNVARQTMEEQASLLESYGAVASANMEASARLIAARATETAQSAQTAERAGGQLADRFAGLVQSMPILEERAGVMAAQLIDSGHALSERIDALESRLHALAEVSDDARSRTLSATKSLTVQLSQLQDATRATSDEINGMAELASNRVGVALDHARTVLEETGAALAGRAVELTTLIDRSREAVNSIGTAGISGFVESSADIETRLHELSRLIEGQSHLAANLSDTLAKKLGTLETRFASFETDGIARSERLAGVLATLGAEAARMDAALSSGNSTAEQLVARSELLMLAIDSSVREMDETYPLALGRLDARVENSRSLLASAAPEIEKMEAIADSIVGRTQEAEELLRGQSRRLTEWLESTESGLVANKTQVEELQSALSTANQSATRLTESAGPQLIAALLRVKDTADQAAERARQALARAIPEAAQALGEASESAMQKAIGDRVTAQIAEVSDVAERAVKAAHQASDRLMRQLLTIADTSASIEQRIQDAERAADERDQDNFARRSALLIESLNSTAIDVSKILSNDVSDASWAAYLKGDRGVFTRRAVKLLDAGEAREIALHYDADAEFREHVNRYIHDFENMLRTILSARDGSALGVTMLSSDIGKLYVALAQAIERLRH